MEFFLKNIAGSLYKEFGEKLNSHCLVFPGRRAGLFFLKYLSAEIHKPVWTPEIMTINDLFHSLSDYQLAENEVLLFELYKCYCSLKKSRETFEDFFFWGDMLLNDFDDADKYLADSSSLFRNVTDIKKIDQEFGGLTKEQAEILKRFWVNFDPEKSTAEKTGFISIWSILSELYMAFRDSLAHKNIAYEGMIFRDVSENELWNKSARVNYEMVHFIGFNALNECEKALMAGLKEQSRARFYWDYDNSYVSERNINSAGYFLRHNISMFGNDMPGDWNYDTMLSAKGRIVRRRVIDTSSDIAQVKLVPSLLGDLAGLTGENAHETAIILPDENLLLPLLSSLPENIGEINLTMGFPLKQTPFFSLITTLFELQRNAKSKDGDFVFSYSKADSVLSGPLISVLIKDADKEIISKIDDLKMTWIPRSHFSGSGLLSVVFRKAETPLMLSDYIKDVLLLISRGSEAESGETGGSFLHDRHVKNEFIYRIILSINRLDGAIARSEISITTETWMRILERLLKGQSVPFSGEPLSGLQIMGILETRALDFRNLVILSVNEGTIPSASAASSFIPFNIREAFGLPSVNHQESVFAYHFYRLLHRAEDVTFVYNSNPDGLKTGEMSRFLQQMKYDRDLLPGFFSSGFEIINPGTVKNFITRTGEHSRRLLARLSNNGGAPYISATSVNTWLNCRMKYYYRYVCGLEEPEQTRDEIDPAMLGILLHDILKNIYQGHIGHAVSSGTIDGILSHRRDLEMMVEKSISENYRNSAFSFNAGNELLVKDVLLVYIERILITDRISSPFTVLEVEKPFRFSLAGIPESIVGEISAGGRIDRIDRREGAIRIIDYKTGSVSSSINSVSDLFTEDRDKGPDGWLQAFLYCEGYKQAEPGSRVVPEIYRAKKVPGEQAETILYIKQKKSNPVPVDNYDIVREEFKTGLKFLIKTIFSPDEPFKMTDKSWNKCPYCPYKVLCNR